MNVLYCGDENIERGLIISILSLLKNVNEELKIYILTINLKKVNVKGVTDDIIKILDDLVKTNNIKSFVKKIDITSFFESEIPQINMDTRFTPCCMLRLFADEIEQIPDKILYLDNDVIIRKNIQEFYHQDISEFEFARSFGLLW